MVTVAYRHSKRSCYANFSTDYIFKRDNIYEAPCVAKILINALNKLRQKYTMKRTHDILIFDILFRNAYNVPLPTYFIHIFPVYFVRVFTILYACTFQYTLCVYISVYFVRVHFSILCACTFQYTLCVYISVCFVRVNGAYLHICVYIFNTSCKKSYIILNQYGGDADSVRVVAL